MVDRVKRKKEERQTFRPHNMGVLFSAINQKINSKLLIQALLSCI